MKSSQRVRDIGEFELIAHLAHELPHVSTGAGKLELGIGDDAAVWTPPPGHSLVVTTDALIEGIHFRPGWTDWGSLGHKMLAVNLSDIAAMGATPRLATVVLGLTGSELVDDIEALYVGAGSLAAAFGVVIAGGDVVRSPNGVVLSVTVVGDVPAGEAMTRSGARPGDLVVVSGTLGASAAGMALLERGHDHSSTGPLLIAAHLRPTPRLALGRLLHKGGATAAMDLSDGLLGDLPKIIEASGVAAEIDVEKIPVLPAVRALFPDRFEEFALRGGEDYELLLTVPEDRFARLRRKAGDVAATLTPIGRIVERTEDEPLRLLKAGVAHHMPQRAFDHFA